MILKKLVVICLTRTGHCPKVKRKKNTIKTVLSCICISWHPNSKKQTWETYQLPMHAVWNQSFCCQSEKITRSKHSCKEARIRAHRVVYGCAGENQRKGIFSFAGIPLGYAWTNKKKKKEREKDQTKAFEANIKHNIHNFYLVVRFRMVSFRGQRKLGPRPGTGLL